MNVGELFVSLGVKGAEKTVGAITTVKDGLKGIASTSLETKAAVVAAIYAIERLFQASGQRGTALENFSTLTGMATKTIQQYQWAAQQVGISNQEVEQSFISLQKNMTKTLLGKGAPEGLALFAQSGGNVTAEDIKKYQEHPELLMQKLQEYAQKEKNVGLRNQVMESFGLSQNMIAGLSRNAFTPEVMSKAPTYNDQEIGNLDKANAKWKNLGTSIEMMFGKLNAKHGGGFVDDLQKLIGPLERVILALVDFAEKIKLFDGLKIVFEGVAEAINQIGIAIKAFEDSDVLKWMIGAGKKGMATLDKALEAGATSTGKIMGGESAIPSIFDSFKDVFSRAEPAKKPGAQNTAPSAKPKIPGKVISPERVAPKAPMTNNSAMNQEINVNQNFTFQNDDGAPGKVGNEFKKSVQSAARQIPALGQGS